jgi:hypothetical protein
VRTGQHLQLGHPDQVLKRKRGGTATVPPRYAEIRR